MHQMTGFITQTLPDYGLYNIANLVNTASLNWKALLADSSHDAKYFLPNELMTDFGDVDFALIHILVDPVKMFSIVNSSDP